MISLSKLLATYQIACAWFALLGGGPIETRDVTGRRRSKGVRSGRVVDAPLALEIPLLVPGARTGSVTFWMG